MNMLPRGVVGYAQVTSDQGSITTEVDLTGLSVTFTAVAGRRYRVTGQILVTSTVQYDLVYFKLTNSSNTTLQLVPWTIPAASSNMAPPPINFVVAPGGGSTTYKLRLLRQSGSGTVTMGANATYPAFICVEDIGKS